MKLTVIVLIGFALAIWAEKIKWINSYGVHFADRGKILIEKSKWNLKYDIPINNFMAESFHLKKCKVDIALLCDKLKHNKNCVYFHKFIESNEKLMNEELRKIKTISNGPKRSLFMVAIAYFYLLKNWLSGNDMNQKIIDKLEEEDQVNRNLTLQHIQISNLTLQTQNKLFNGLKNSINLLRKQIDEARNLTMETKLEITLGNIISEANMILVKHYQILSSFTKVLTAEIDTNIINIIGRKTFLNNLMMVSKKMRGEERLPLEITDSNLFNLLLISNTTAKFIDTTIVLSIALPTVGNFEYTHYQIFAIPRKVDAKMWLAVDLAENILLNKQNREYMLPSNMELTGCQVINATTKICSLTAPIYRKPICELEMLLFNNTAYCRFEEIAKHGYIKRIDRGEFIISPFMDIEVFIICGNSTSVARRIYREAIVTIDDGCSLENDELRYVVNGETVENIFISEGPVEKFYSQINDVLKTVVHNLNGTNPLENSDQMYDNISLELAKLHEFASIQPKHIVVSEDEFNGLILIMIALVVLVCIRWACSWINQYLS